LKAKGEMAKTPTERAKAGRKGLNRGLSFRALLSKGNFTKSWVSRDIKRTTAQRTTAEELIRPGVDGPRTRHGDTS